MTQTVSVLLRPGCSGSVLPAVQLTDECVNLKTNKSQFITDILFLYWNFQKLTCIYAVEALSV